MPGRRSPRTIFLLVALTGGACLSGAALRPAGAAQNDIGTYLTPFREDGATYAVAADTFTGGRYLGQATDANGCVADGSSISPQGNPGAYRCLPAGASMVQLSDGRVLYWNALEGTENVSIDGRDAQGLPVSTVPDGGRLTVNDESRVLTNPTTAPQWSVPTPRDSGGHNTSTAEDLPLPQPLAATHWDYNNGSLFCSDQVVLANGDILTAGGTDYYSEPTFPDTGKGVVELEGIRAVRLFHAATDTWLQAAPMNHGRWYPSLVTLPDGRLFVASGVTKLIKPLYPSHAMDSGTNVRQTEVYDPTKDTWTETGTAGERSLPLFPRLHLLPDGKVFYDAGGQAYNPQGQSYDEATWNKAATWDPTTKVWTELGIPGIDTTAPAFRGLPGFRGSTFSAALELRPASDGSYPSASYLTAGGVVLPTPGSYVATTDSRIDTVTTDAKGTETLTAASTNPLGRARWYSSGIPLPDGTVFATSGADVDEVLTPGYESPIRTDELFTPALGPDGTYTGGQWRDVGDQARRRTYHNNAILLPDGSVLIGGHAPIPSGYNQTQDGPDLPGRPGTNNHHDPSFQVWRPPYFGADRPRVSHVDASGDGRLVVETPDASHITSVVLVRNTAQTHLIDADNRTVKLPVMARTSSTVTVAMPGSTNVLPNGPYLLFAVAGADGDPGKDVPGKVVPSIGQQVFVEGTAVPHLLPVAPKAGATVVQTASPSTHRAAGLAAPMITQSRARIPAEENSRVVDLAPVTTPPRRMLAAPARSDHSVPGVPAPTAAAALGLLLLVGRLAWRAIRQT